MIRNLLLVRFIDHEPSGSMSNNEDHDSCGWVEDSICHRKAYRWHLQEWTPCISILGKYEVLWFGSYFVKLWAVVSEASSVCNVERWHYVHSINASLRSSSRHSMILDLSSTLILWRQSSQGKSCCLTENELHMFQGLYITFYVIASVLASIVECDCISPMIIIGSRTSPFAMWRDLGNSFAFQWAP